MSSSKRIEIKRLQEVPVGNSVEPEPVIDETDDSTLSIPSSDVIRLIQAYLLEVGGYTKTIAMLQQESHVGMAGALPHHHSNFYFHACAGQWSEILKTLRLLDMDKVQQVSTSTSSSPLSVQDVVAMVHEMVILELAEANDFELAYATYRMVQKDLEHAKYTDSERDFLIESTDATMTRGRLLEQKLAALHSKRANNRTAPLPEDYYGPPDVDSERSTKQVRRELIGTLLQDCIPRQPAKRLTALLQQALKWQIHTGQLPAIKEYYAQDETKAEEDPRQHDEATAPVKRKRRKKFDLVLGQVSVEEVPVGTSVSKANAKKRLKTDPIISDPFAVVKFGKKATAESAIFLPNCSFDSDPLNVREGGLVTGSSDGLIEIWDPSQQYETLRMDLAYQAKEELLGHDEEGGSPVAVTALSVSNDGALLASGASNGQVKVWRIDTGKCLRSWKAHEGSSISCLAFSHDRSHVLTASHDGTCREFGLRTTRMLKEFRGHSSYISSCSYQFAKTRDGHADLVVVTASGDGSVRLWGSKTMEVIKVLRPVSIGPSLSNPGSSILVDGQTSEVSDSGAPAVSTVLHLHTPAGTMIIVPRGYRAFLVNYDGIVLRTFQDDGQSSEKVFVAASVSASNQWLYAVKEDGVCCVFNIDNGELEKTIRDFGSETTRMPKDSNAVAEISSVTHHPTKNLIAAFSNDKGQKKGQLVVWK